MIASGSGECTTKGIGCLLGGTINIALERVAGIVNSTYESKDPLGRWSTFQLEGGSKTMCFITFIELQIQYHQAH